MFARILLMLALGPANWLKLRIWLALGMLINFCDCRHTHLGKERSGSGRR
jgi:hypothetical protein